MRPLALRVLVLVLAAAQPLVAAWVQSGRRGATLGVLLDRHPAHVAPATYTLIIASPIFALALALAALQLRGVHRADPTLGRVAPALAAAYAATSAWMLAFQAELFATGVLLVLVAVVALGLAAAEVQRRPPAGSRNVRRLVRAAVGLHLGWASVGLLALAGHAAHAYGWSGFGLDQRFWSYFAVVMGGFATAGAVGALRGGLAFAVGSIWAFLGIVVAQWDGARAATAPAVGTAALFAAALTALSYVVATGKRRADERRLWMRRGRLSSAA